LAQVTPTQLLSCQVF